jgi:tetratricopeptide (TPR) repeat protein
MKTIDFSYFIERYIASEMDQSEKKWFEMELEGNASLQKELTLRRRADAALIRHDILDLRNKLAAIEKQRREKIVASGTKKTAGLRFAAAIAALLLLGGAYLLTTGHQSSEKIYSKNFVAYQPSPIARSGELKLSDFETARDFYNSNNYVQAASLLKSYLQLKPQSMEAKLLYGVSEMENNNFQAAKGAFRSIIVNSDNLYIDKAQWYLALCYIRTNEKEEALNQLMSIINSNSIYRDKARKITKKIR